MVTTIDVAVVAPRQSQKTLPLAGVTILLVEDSRYCAEAMRLLCRKSGARLRRADCQRAAYRHLATYRPSVVVVDIGLPDGCGLDLVRSIRARGNRARPVILVCSGDDPTEARAAAQAAGADEFLSKPLCDPAQFQRKMAALLPGLEVRDTQKPIALHGKIEPDNLAVVDDLRNIRTILLEAIETQKRGRVAYCAQFLLSLAQTTGSRVLADLGHRLAIWSQLESAPFQRLTATVLAIGSYLDTAVKL